MMNRLFRKASALIPARSPFAPPVGTTATFDGRIPEVTLDASKPLARWSQAGAMSVRGAR